ncbi:MAG: uracil-DNA glycosylase family protein [Pseudomonadota bacterium]
MPRAPALSKVLSEVRACTHCAEHLPLGPRPVLRAKRGAKVLLVGQAPGTRVHASGIPWDDPSGDRLREWLGVDKKVFYDERLIAIVPMGFCYPGKGKSGDAPPRPECAPLWHEKILAGLPQIELTLLIGQYAQQYYLEDEYKTLTERVRNWREAPPNFLPLPHPSPRNRLWLKKNSWFEEEVLPYLSERISSLLM